MFAASWENCFELLPAFCQQINYSRSLFPRVLLLNSLSESMRFSIVENLKMILTKILLPELTYSCST